MKRGKSGGTFYLHLSYQVSWGLLLKSVFSGQEGLTYFCCVFRAVRAYYLPLFSECSRELLLISVYSGQ